MSNSEKIKIAEDATNTDPTEAQKVSGNYTKGKVTLEGLKITIENPVGSMRSGVDKDGNTWSNKMLFTYGYFNGTIGKDGDQIDVFIGDAIDGEFDIYVVDQVEEDSRAFDEHKVMFGFSSEEEAKEAYLKSYAAGWTGLQNIVTFSLSKFKTWLTNTDAIKYPASRLNMTSKIDFKNAETNDASIARIRLFGEVLESKTLDSLKAQLSNFDDYQTLIVEIASPGGSVSEGLEIMVWLDSLSQQGIQVITVVVANAYSIASLIMLAADIRLISIHGKVMVHNPMVPELEYVNANDLEKYVTSLRELEALMYELYQTFTGLEEKKIKSLMDNETYLLPQEAVDNGFADMVVDIKPKPFQMATNIKKEINMHKTLNILNKVISVVNKAEFVNQLYYTNEGSEVEITQADASTFKTGDSINAKDGEVKLSNGSVLKVENSKITDITRAADADGNTAEFNEGPAPVVEGAEIEIEVESPEDDEPIVEPAKAAEGDEPIVEPIVEPVVEPMKEGDTDPKKVIEKTKTVEVTKETVNATITEVMEFESEVVNDTFSLGDKVEYISHGVDGTPYAVGAGEWKLDDGRTILTDAGGVIRFITEAPVAIVEDPIVDPVVETAKVEEEAKTKASIKALEEKVANLSAKAETAEVKAKEFEAKFESSAKFESLATKAIDTIAESTVSNFKPDAKISAKVAAKGSIFTQMRERAGLN